MSKPFVFIEEDGEIWAEDNLEHLKEVSKKKYELRLKQSNIPQDYYSLEFNMYQGTKSLESKKCVEIYSKKCRDEKYKNVSLYLVGANSSQKTMLACAAGKEFIKQGFKIKFILAGHLINILMKTQGFNYLPELEKEKKSLLENIDLLIIDDIFDPNKSMFWKNSPELILAEWDAFLRHAISNNIRLILTSNYNINYLKEKFGNDLFHLIERNFKELTFYDSISQVRKDRFQNLFTEDKNE